MECSKCHVVKSIDGYYATGRVCKQCKIDYARNYRRSKTVSNTQSKAAHTDENIYERLKKLESYINIHELLQKLELHVGNLSKVNENALERMQKIDIHESNSTK